MRLRKLAMWRVMLCVAAGLGLAGCTSAPLNVTAMRFDIEAPRARQFQLAEPQITGADDQLAATHLASYVTAALVNRGFQPAPAGQPGRMVIDIIFEQESPPPRDAHGDRKDLPVGA